MTNRVDALLVGYGQMGTVIAERLPAPKLTVYDVDPSRRDAARRAGHGVADNLDEKEAPLVILALPGPPQVNQVVGTLQGTHALVLDTTSVDPDTAAGAAKSVATGSGRYVEMPVLGGPPQAGSWVFLAGGADADVRDATRIVEPLGRVVHFGPVGSGSRAKLLNNILTGINAAAVAEVLALTERLGVDLRTLYEAINGSGSAGRNAVWEVRVPKMLAGTLQDTFSIDLMVKDLKLAVSMASEAEIPTPVASAALDRYVEAVARHWGGRDIGRLAQGLSEDGPTGR